MSEKLKVVSEEWEFDFSNPPQIKPPNCSTCANCGDLVHSSDVVIKQYYTGTMTDVEHFCSDDCHHAWFIQRLNQWGL